MNKLATRTTGIFAAMTAVLITAFAALVAMPPDAQAQALENIRLVSNLTVQGHIHADRAVGGNNNALAQKFRIPNGPNYILGNVNIRVKNRAPTGLRRPSVQVPVTTRERSSIP